MLHLFNIFRENDGKENCAEVLEEEVYKMFGTKFLNDGHNCNVVTLQQSTCLPSSMADGKGPESRQQRALPSAADGKHARQRKLQ